MREAAKNTLLEELITHVYPYFFLINTIISLTVTAHLYLFFLVGLNSNLSVPSSWEISVMYANVLFPTQTFWQRQWHSPFTNIQQNLFWSNKESEKGYRRHWRLSESNAAEFILSTWINPSWSWEQPDSTAVVQLLIQFFGGFFCFPCFCCKSFPIFQRENQILQEIMVSWYSLGNAFYLSKTHWCHIYIPSFYWLS